MRVSLFCVLSVGLMLIPEFRCTITCSILLYGVVSTACCKILGFLKLFGCCSNPAYEKVFLKATPLTKKESLIDPPVTYLIPIKSLSSKVVSNFSTAETTI